MTNTHWLLARFNERKAHDAMLGDGNSGDTQMEHVELRETQSEGRKGFGVLIS